MQRLAMLLVVLIAGVVFAPASNAVIWTLHDYNSEFVVDTDNTPYQWNVDGTYQMYQQGFWWRVGYTGGETFLGGSSYVSGQLLGDNILLMNYNTGTFTTEVIYTLVGGGMGSGNSDVAETIHIRALSAINLSFFQYCDFDLGGTPGDDQLWFSNSNAVRQVDNGGAMIGETVVTPAPARHEGSLYDTLITSLNDGSPTTLSDLPAVGGGSITGDCVWAFYWNINLPAGGDFIISKDKNLTQIPEPGTMLLLGVGLLGVEVLRRRSKRA